MLLKNRIGENLISLKELNMKTELDEIENTISAHHNQ